MNIGAAYADAYDVLYGDDRALLDAQMAFLATIFGDNTGPLLDAGCGTGRHLLPLATRGCPVTGLDYSALMLAIADAKLKKAGLESGLVIGDLRNLPLGQSFAGAICLDSPLAFMLTEDDLARALSGLHRVLRAGGRLVAEVFDYPGTLGDADAQPHSTRFGAEWGHVDVREDHRYDSVLGIWEMRQTFTVRRSGGRNQFAVTHRLRIRTVDEYAAALEAAGFTIQDLLPRYPGTRDFIGDERRLILVASR